MAAEQTANPLIPMLLIGLIMYFVVIKPERDKQKKRKEGLSQLKKNDQVITAGGIYGIVVNIKDKSVIVRVDDNVRLEITKDSINSIINKESQTK